MTAIQLFIDRDDISRVSEMLICGLEAIGRIELSRNRHEVYEWAEHTKLPDDLKPLHPLAGDDEWMTRYAGALRTVAYIEAAMAKAELEGSRLEVRCE